MKKNIVLLCALVMGALMLTSFSSINADNQGTIVGKWTLITTEIYDEASSTKQSEEKIQGVVWEFTDQKIIIHDKDDELDGITLDYIFKDRLLSVNKISLTFKANEISDSKLVLRSSPLGGRYFIHTFKKAQ